MPPVHPLLLFVCLVLSRWESNVEEGDAGAFFPDVCGEFGLNNACIREREAMISTMEEFFTKVELNFANRLVDLRQRNDGKLSRIETNISKLIENARKQEKRIADLEKTVESLKTKG